MIPATTCWDDVSIFNMIFIVCFMVQKIVHTAAQMISATRSTIDTSRETTGMVDELVDWLLR